MIFRGFLTLLLNRKKFCLLFVINLSLGFLGFITLDSFKSSVLESVHRSSKEYLSGDLALYARRKVTDEELLTARRNLPQGFLESKMTEMYTMVRYKDQSRLVLLNIVDHEFPLYGQIELENKGGISFGKNKEINQSARVWVYPEILLQMGISLGDSIFIGEKMFEVTDVVLNSPGQTSGFAALAPVVFMGQDFLPSTGLVRKGSTFWESYLFKVSNEFDVDSLRSKIENQLVSSGVRIVTHKKASEQASRILIYLNDYLGLAGIVALILVSIGAVFLCKSFLWGEIKTIAIRRAVGQSHWSVSAQYLLFLVVLGLVSVPLTALLASILLPMLKSLLLEVSFFELEVKLQPESLLWTFFLIIVTVVFINIPLLIRLQKLKISDLFHESTGRELDFNLRNTIMYFPFLVFFWLLAVWQAKSYIVASLFIGSLFLAIIFLTVFYYYLSKVIANFQERSPFLVKYAILSLIRKPGSSIAIFSAVCLCVILISFIFNLEKSLQSEVSLAGNEKVPSLFMFDIQEEQIGDIQNIVRSHKVELQDISPMIRSKLIYVNDKEFERGNDEDGESQSSLETRESERERRFRNRGMNLSFRKGLAWSESIVKGEPLVEEFDSEVQSMPEISLEFRFADRLGFHLGDVLEFDVQGVSVKGRVKNFRRVKWTSFQPNFFIQFQEGVLDMAPKTYIATMPQVADSLKAEIQLDVVKSHPNVSMVDVTRLVQRILEIFLKMSLALKLMAVLALLAAVAVVVSISLNLSGQRKGEVSLYKALGLEIQSIKKIYWIEIYILTFFASFTGVLISLVLTFSMTQYVFFTQFSISPLASALLILLVPLLSLAAIALGLRRVFLLSPREYLI